MSEHENCHVDPIEKPIPDNALQNAKAVFLGVSGMGCGNCANRVRNGLLTVDGVYLAEVQLEQGVAAVAFNPAKVTTESLIQAVSAAGGNDGRHNYQAEFLKEMPASEALR